MRKINQPKFQLDQRVYDHELGFGYLVVKGIRLITEANPNHNRKVIYEGTQGKQPEWEYNGYSLKNGKEMTHREIGWFRESWLGKNEEEEPENG